MKNNSILWADYATDLYSTLLEIIAALDGGRIDYLSLFDFPDNQCIVEFISDKDKTLSNFDHPELRDKTCRQICHCTYYDCVQPCTFHLS